MNEAEELHKESLEILAKLASNTPSVAYNENNVISNYKVSQCLKTPKQCMNCSQEKCIGTCDKENLVPDSQCLKTPQKQRTIAEPITPTANLKMLMCAASVLTPALSNRDDEKRNLFKEIPLQEKNIQENIINVSLQTCVGKEKSQKSQLLGRKEKSLGLLCKRFLTIYPEYSENGTTILLDDVVRELGINRRRVYDIVNVLESMEMMVRQAKNKYLWYGKSRLAATLTKLKALSFLLYGNEFGNAGGKFRLTSLQKTSTKPLVSNSLDVLTKTFRKDQDNEVICKKEEETTTNKGTEDTECEHDDVTSSIMDYIIFNESTKKETSRSLGILCQKFIMLFMVAEDNIVTLDKAARILLNESEEGEEKYKTKVRRLYDIANILTSIQFLEKTSSFENASKKAAYKWVGLDLKTLDSEDGIKKAFQSLEFSVTRHSLLAQVPKLPSDLRSNGQRKLQCRSASAHQLSSQNSGKFDDAFKAKFSRTHSAVAPTKEDVDDGFDIEQFQECTDESNGGCEESPNQKNFKEKLKKLQEEFPDKLPNTGLIELLKATKQPMSNVESSSITANKAPSSSVTVSSGRPKLRRSLSGEFKEDSISPPKKVKLDFVNAEKSHSNQPQLAALKPLLSYSDANTLKSTSLQISNVQLPDSSNANQNGILPNLTKPTKCFPIENKVCRPLIVSNLTNPISLQKANGVYLIQCKTLQGDKPIHAVPVVLGQKAQGQHNLNQVNTTPSSGMVTMLMRQPIVTVTSPSVLLSPRNQILKKPGNEVSNNQQAAEKYPEYFTPPHAVLHANGKPAANPIIFPKMTPETPSSDPKSVLNAVTRKLMSFQNEESR